MGNPSIACKRRNTRRLTVAVALVLGGLTPKISILSATPRCADGPGGGAKTPGGAVADIIEGGRSFLDDRARSRAEGPIMAEIDQRRTDAAKSGGMAASTVLSLQGAAFLGIGLYALGAGFAALTTGGLALIPIGFYGATATATAGGAFVMGTGFTVIGGVNLFAASKLREMGE